jgi:hypothetical protein
MGLRLQDREDQVAVEAERHQQDRRRDLEFQVQPLPLPSRFGSSLDQPLTFLAAAMSRLLVMAVILRCMVLDHAKFAFASGHADLSRKCLDKR